MAPPTVRFSGVTRRYPGVVALSGVSFEVAAGSCHAVCGENGAGKSTLGKILAGIERADAGTVELDGSPLTCRGPREALAAGIAIVHQELALWDNLSVAENLMLARLPRRGLLVDRAAVAAQAKALLAEVGADFDGDRPLDSLTVAEQQLVQIAMAIGAEARVIVFDEPTSSLGERETERLYQVIASLRARGTTILYVSHRMPEIFRLCDRVTVLRDGAHVATRNVAELDEASLVELMIGRRLEQFFPAHADLPPGASRLEVEGLHVGDRVRGVSLSIRSGEVVGLAGLVGSGRSDVAQALFGLRRDATGQLKIHGRPVRLGSPRAAMAHGIGFVPEDRKRQGLVLSMVNRENGSLPTLPRHARWGWVNRRREGGAVGAAFASVGMAAGLETGTRTLSGGNQQKVALAKWLAASSDVLILDEPTRGVDVGAKAELHAWIGDYAAGGGAVLLITSDMPELLHLSSRILVLREGRLVGELSRQDATQDRLLRLMSGLARSA